MMRATKKYRASTLLEILLASALIFGVLALGAEALRYFWQHDNARQQTMVQIRDGQWVIQQMARTLRSAGFGPLLPAATQANNRAPWNSYLQNYGMPVLWCPYGLMSASSVDAVCASVGTGNPTLVVRTLQDGDSAPMTSDSRVQDCLGNGVPNTGVPNTGVPNTGVPNTGVQNTGMAYVETRFSLRSATQQLYCQGNGRTDAAANLLSAQPIFDKVTAFRVYFLRDTDGDDRIDTESEPAPSFSAWETVLAVRVCLETSSNRTSSSNVPANVQSYLDCDDHWQTALLGQFRSIFQQTVGINQEQ